MGPRERGCDVRFGIDRRSACSAVQGALGGRVHDRRVHAGQFHGDCAGKPLGQELGPRRVARPTRAPRHDRASDEPRSAWEVVGEPARNAEADDCPRPARELALELGGEMLRVASARNGAHAGSSGDARFLDEPRDRNDRKPGSRTDIHNPKRT